jgi:pheromone shutdown-related protein TraB
MIRLSPERPFRYSNRTIPATHLNVMQASAEVHDQADTEPLLVIEHGDKRITLLGTAHVSQASADKVRELLEGGDYDAVAVELCPSRHNAIVNADALARMNLFEVLRKRKTLLVIANLVLGAYQQRMATQLGTEPGAEMRAAVDGARERGLPVLLVDREIAVTMKRVYHGVGWWSRVKLIAGLLDSLLSRREISEAEIENLKRGDILESVVSDFAREARELYVPLIEERDRYMSLRLAAETTGNGYRNVLAVVGAGHLRGMREQMSAILESTGDSGANQEKSLAELDAIPPPSRWPSIISWGIVIAVFAGFAAGFAHSPSLGKQMVIDWVLITGGLAALGTVIAGGHYLTVIAAFLAAPLTALNPVIGAGMVTAALETWLRKPQVSDFSRLREDTVRLRGWWENRVSRILLIFFTSSLGAAAGTYAAGFLIFQRLLG